ncbi:MAG: zf-HC2 domain-containing protein [Fibrobacteres bacterium]|nr:zf-HC2 domain-containing protein [Fibrobacterota bacterium]
MEHEKYQRMAMRLADKELDDAAKQELQSHLSICPECTAFANDLGPLSDAFSPLQKEEGVNGALNTFMSNRAIKATEKVSLLEQIRETFWGRQHVLRYAGLALILGAIAGGAGFKLQNKPITPSYISAEEEALFNPVYPGSITEVVNDEHKESL